MSAPLRHARLFLVAWAALAPAAASRGTSLVSHLPDGAAGDALSRRAVLSADGRFAAFESDASDLVPNDTNGVRDVLVRDLQTGAITRVSVASDGSEADQPSSYAAISADGRYVAFQSNAANLSANDFNHTTDIFVHDRQTGVTERVSRLPDGSAPLSASSAPVLSGDGRYVSFLSGSNQLVAGDVNGFTDVFVVDRQTGVTVRASVNDAGVGGDQPSSIHAISADGSAVAFVSSATNLVPNDQNGFPDIFVRDLTAGTTTRVSVGPGGVEADDFSGSPSISADGRLVAFDSWATNLDPAATTIELRVYVRDLDAGTTRAVSVPPGGSFAPGASARPSLSASGRYVAYETRVGALLPAPSSVFQVVRTDLLTGEHTLVSRDESGATPSTESDVTPHGAISADGRFVVFDNGGGLAAADTNGVADVYLRDTGCSVAFEAIGTGLAGTGGLVPSLSGNAGACDDVASVTLSNALGAAPTLLWIGLGEASQAALGGTLVVDLGAPHAIVPISIAGPAGAAGAGTYTTHGIDASSAFGVPLFLQATVGDPGAPFGVAFSNGLRAAVE
ncbi:MAG: TolB family protein [Planctomycetota bacterium JB042]